MLFEDIIGQIETSATLRSLSLNDRLPHALLLLGREGSGKLAIALALAAHLVCENPSLEDSCGQCSSCVKSLKFIHPDIHFVFPVVGTNAKSDQYLTQWRSAMADNPYQNINQWLQLIGAENKQGNINKEECLSIIRKLSLKTFESKKKVMIIWLPEYLQKEGNRLLKIIEEPPANTHFILVAQNQELILNTILSRCQLISIRPLADEDIIDGLRKKNVATPENLSSIARLSNGNFNEALQLASSKVNNHAVQFLDWMRKCYKGSAVELVSWTETFAQTGREEQKYFLRYALHFLREYLIMKVSGQDQLRLNEEETKTARRMTSILEFEQVESIVGLLNDAIYAVERNANPKILFLDNSIKLNRILKHQLIYEQQFGVLI